MREICDRTGRLAAWLVLILPGLLAAGCDRPPPPDREVPLNTRILWFVEDVEDFAHTERELERIKPLFVAEAQPSKESLERYKAYHYEGKTPVVSGDSATVPVMLKDAETGEPAGEVQWSLVRVKGKWRFKEAPLPAKTRAKRKAN